MTTIDWRKDEQDKVVRRTAEIEAFEHQSGLKLRDRFRPLEELIFEQEIFLMFDPKHARNIIQPTAPSRLQNGIYFNGDPFVLNRDYIEEQVQKRLAANFVYVERSQIRALCKNIDNVFRSSLAQGRGLSVISHIEGIVRAKLANHENVQRLPYLQLIADEELRDMIALPKAHGKRGPKPKAPKSGKKRGVWVDGEYYESINKAADANKHKGLSYRVIQYHSMKAMKEAHT